jgi:hypothetical protein
VQRTQRERLRAERLLGQTENPDDILPEPLEWRRCFAPRLRFDERAIERLTRMDWSVRRIFHRELWRIHDSVPVFKTSVVNTRPKVYEVEAGHGYRIYCQVRGGSILIVLVGDKGSQRRDCDFLAKKGSKGGANAA